MLKLVVLVKPGLHALKFMYIVVVAHAGINGQNFTKQHDFLKYLVLVVIGTCYCFV